MSIKILATLVLFVVTSLCHANTYSVPVSQELIAHSIWSNITAEAHKNGNELSIAYKLPEDLVGKNSPGFSASGFGSGSFVPVSGTDVFGYCMKSKDKPLECMLKYPKSIVDISSRDIALREHFTGDQLRGRSEVARLFSADPAGLLSVELK